MFKLLQWDGFLDYKFAWFEVYLAFEVICKNWLFGSWVLQVVEIAISFVIIGRQSCDRMRYSRNGEGWVKCFQNKHFWIECVSLMLIMSNNNSSLNFLLDWPKLTWFEVFKTQMCMSINDFGIVQITAMRWSLWLQICVSKPFWSLKYFVKITCLIFECFKV